MSQPNIWWDWQSGVIQDQLHWISHPGLILPGTPYGVLKFTLTLPHRLHSSHCHSGSFQTGGETQQRQTPSLSCTFSSQGTARSGGNMNSHHTRMPLFHLPKWRFMLPWGSDFLKHIKKIVNAISPARLWNNLLFWLILDSNYQPCFPVWSSRICKTPWR